MPSEGNESTPIIVYGGRGGDGGRAGEAGKGGRGGTGEGPTFNYSRVESVTNNIVNQGQELEEDLYKWLESPPDIKDRQHELRKLCHESTGHWLLDDLQFINWKTTPSSLWIKGISGTGKSVLSSTVIENITVGCSDWTAVAYFYFDFRNERQHMDIMLCSIIWQLSRRSPSPYGSLQRLYKTLGNGTIQPQQRHLQGVLEDLLSELDQTFIVIDGLDECNKTDWKNLIEFIQSLCHRGRNTLHLLFTSQPLEKFQKEFKDVPFIELGSAVSMSDIRSYIGSEVPRVGNWANDNKYAKDVMEKIVQRSNGMFRLAACFLIELRGCYFREDVEETLAGLPADLFGIYGRFLTRAKDSLKKTVFIQAIFRWLVFSARELTSDELADAIAFPLSDPQFDFADPAKSIYNQNRHGGNLDIFKLLEGLIIMKNELQDKVLITFAHSSVKDYVLSLGFQQAFGPIIDLREDVSHRFIAQTCVRYLLLFGDDKHPLTKDTLPDYPIALYAAEHWFHHLQLCDAQDQAALFPLTMDLLKDGSSQHVAFHRLSRLCWYKTRVWDGVISPPVCMCSRIGYTEGVRWLLIEGSTSVDLANEYGGTALHIASRYGHLDITRLLIEHKAPVDFVEKNGCTALHLALENGHPNIATLLIEYKASVNLVDNFGWTAVHLASRHGHLNITRLLIERMASVDLVDNDGWTALHLASGCGHLDIVRLLIKHKASINLVNNNGWTALHIASACSHLDIVRLLIEHKASVDLVDNDGWTALHHALKYNRLDIARLLIEHKVSVDLVDNDGWTGLHDALSNGHLNITRLLIEYKASVDLVNNNGWTVPH